MAKEKHSSVASYIIVALILGVITYIEFAIVEYPQAWLGREWTLFWLVALSVVKFIMVIMFFMHLKDDDRTYTGFFSSGMFIALATFVGMTAMFILPKAVATTRPTDVVAGKASHDVPQELLDNVASDGLSRGPAANADSPRPADRSVVIEPPMAANDASTYQLNTATAPLEPGAEAAGQQGAGEEDASIGPADEVGADAAAAQAAAASADTEDAADAAGSQADAAAEATQEEAATGAADATADTASWDPEQGAAVYAANCVACHQGSGQGIPAAFPPLAGNAVDIYEAGGRQYLIDVVLFGMQGSIEIGGMTYNGVMPAWAQLADSDIANVLNHIVTAWDDEPSGFSPYQESDVAAQRDLGLSPTDVHALRGELGL